MLVLRRGRQMELSLEVTRRSLHPLTPLMIRHDGMLRRGQQRLMGPDKEQRELGEAEADLRS
jgi:hypothetical protein